MAGGRMKRRAFFQAGALGLSVLALPGMGRVTGRPASAYDRDSYAGRICYNENPLGPSPAALKAMTRVASDANRYPDWYNDVLESRLGASLGLPRNAICVGAGATELIRLIADAFLGPGDEMITATPTYFQMASDAVRNGASVVNVPLDETYAIDLDAVYDAITAETVMISMVNPNNPVAVPVHRERMEDFVHSLPDGIITVVDEAYHHYVGSRTYASCLRYVHEGLPVVVIRTFSKAYGLAGARIGFAAAPPQYISQIASSQLFGTVSNMSQAGALAALEDTTHLARSVSVNNQAKRILMAGAESMDLEYIPSETNFMMIDTGTNAGAVSAALAVRGYQVRTGWGMPQHIRVSTSLPEEMKGFIGALRDVIPQIHPDDSTATFGIHSVLPDKNTGQVMIRFGAAGGDRVNLAVLNRSGRGKTVLVNQKMKPGLHTVPWNGKTNVGRSIPDTQYTVILHQGEWIDTESLDI